jgi:hypothetical protein
MAIREGKCMDQMGDNKHQPKLNPLSSRITLVPNPRQKRDNSQQMMVTVGGPNSPMKIFATNGRLSKGMVIVLWVADWSRL